MSKFGFRDPFYCTGRQPHPPRREWQIFHLQCQDSRSSLYLGFAPTIAASSESRLAARHDTTRDQKTSHRLKSLHMLEFYRLTAHNKNQSSLQAHLLFTHLFVQHTCPWVPSLGRPRLLGQKRHMGSSSTVMYSSRLRCVPGDTHGLQRAAFATFLTGRERRVSFTKA